MNETGASEEAAREHIMHMVREAWKWMNRAMFEDYRIPGLGPFIGACVNTARICHTFYGCGDGFGQSSNITKDSLASAIYDPVPLD